MFGRIDSVKIATRAGHKTVVPALVSLLAILNRKYFNNTRDLSRTNFSSAH